MADLTRDIRPGDRVFYVGETIEAVPGQECRNDRGTVCRGEHRLIVEWDTREIDEIDDERTGRLSTVEGWVRPVEVTRG